MATATRKMSKAELIGYFVAYEDRDVRFVANVVMNWHRRVGTKLAALHRLLMAGRCVRPGNTIDQIRIDGEVYTYEMLELLDGHL